jgi:putative transposase
LYKAASKPEAEHAHQARPSSTGISNERLLELIVELSIAHPAWGHRKIWAMLRRRQIMVARRRVWALMHKAGLTFAPHARRHEPRRGTVIVEHPNRRWSSDMTTTWTRRDGWVAITPVIDNGCRTLFEIGVSKAQDASAILKPIRDALEREFGDATSVPDGLELRTDHGSVYTGADCEELVAEWKLDHTFAPIGRPTGNAVAERVIQTMKLEVLWLRDWESIDEVRSAIDAWKHFYNTERPHEALNWQTPAERRAERLRGSISGPGGDLNGVAVGEDGPSAQGAESPHHQDRTLPEAA